MKTEIIYDTSLETLGKAADVFEAHKQEGFLAFKCSKAVTLSKISLQWDCRLTDLKKELQRRKVWK
jgi:hypothetical protein